LNKLSFDIISKNTKITTEQLNKIYKQKKDWYIDANEALKYGIINEII
jgi:ATP-dependent protease ClpP protease subunit